MMNKKYAGFTRTMLSIAIPLTLQNLLFSSFTLIDTVMVGRLGDLPLAAVGMAGKVLVFEHRALWLHKRCCCVYRAVFWRE